MKIPSLLLAALFLGLVHSAHSANDGSLVIDDFSGGVSAWKAYNGGTPVFSPEEKITHEGKPGLRLLLEANARAERDLEAKDLSDFDAVSVWIYSSAEGNGVIGIALTSERSAEGWNYFYVKVPIDWQGWKNLILRKKDFSIERAPDWTNVQKILFSIRDWGWGVPVQDQFIVISDLELIH